MDERELTELADVNETLRSYLLVHDNKLRASMAREMREGLEKLWIHKESPVIHIPKVTWQQFWSLYGKL